MSKNYLAEAFKKLNILDEEVFEVDTDGLSKLKKFEDDSVKDKTVTVIDPHAEHEQDLEDSYIGKVILDCCVCHSKIYKDKEKVEIDDDLANVGEECHFCYSPDGFKVIGEVAEFREEEDEDSETEEDEVKVKVKVDGEFEDEEVEETKLEESVRYVVRRISNGRYLEADGTVKSTDMKNAHRFDTREEAEKEISTKDGKIIDGWEIIELNEACKGKKKKAEKKLAESLSSEAKLIIADLVDRAMSLMRDGSTAEEATERAIEDGLFYNDDIVTLGREYDVLDFAQIEQDFYEDLYNDIYKEVKDYFPDRTDEACKGKKSRHSRKLKEDVNEPFTAIDPITGEEYHIFPIWRGEQLVTLEDKDGKRTKMYISDMYDTYDIYDVNGNVISRAEDREDIDERFKGNAVKKVAKNESIDSISINTGDQTIQVSTEHNAEIKAEVEAEVEEEVTDSKEETIKPLSTETEKEIEDANTVDVDVEEFDEETFDELGENYLKKAYNNVKSYKTTKITPERDRIKVEGVITFNSGNAKKTNFIFESKDITRKGKAKFIGENLQICKGRKAFTLIGNISNKKFVAESLNYNYKAKDASSGISKRVYGTVQRKI